MVASSPFDESMASALKDRLTRLDDAIDLLQDLRRETASLVAELFPDEV